jgi:hypothetical protein
MKCSIGARIHKTPIKFPTLKSETPKIESSDVGRKLVKSINADSPASGIQCVQIV